MFLALFTNYELHKISVFNSKSAFTSMIQCPQFFEMLPRDLLILEVNTEIPESRIRR